MRSAAKKKLQKKRKEGLGFYKHHQAFQFFDAHICYYYLLLMDEKLTMGE
jgi:hypothetical protein